MLVIENAQIMFRGLEKPALTIENLQINTGEKLAIRGPSGCGKTSFMNMICGLNKPTKGNIFWSDNNIYSLNESQRDKWRGQNIGLIMQDFHLFSGLTALDNVLLPLALSKGVKADDRAFAMDLLEKTGIKTYNRDIRPMSRGEMQRIAIARALLRRPAILIADEPTASLDYENATNIGDLLLALADEMAATFILVTHDHKLYERLPRKIRMESGQIVEDSHS